MQSSRRMRGFAFARLAESEFLLKSEQERLQNTNSIQLRLLALEHLDSKDRWSHVCIAFAQAIILGLEKDALAIASMMDESLQPGDKFLVFSQHYLFNRGMSTPREDYPLGFQLFNRILHRLGPASSWFLRETFFDDANVENASLAGHEFGNGKLGDWVLANKARLLQKIRRQMSVRIAAHVQADDVLQDALIVALEKKDGCEIKSSECVERWLLTLTRNVIRNLSRHSSTRSDGQSDSFQEPTCEHSSEKLHIGHDRHLRPQVNDQCNAIWALPESERITLILRDGLDASWSTLVALTRRPTVQAAQKFHTRCRSKLRDALTPISDSR